MIYTKGFDGSMLDKLYQTEKRREQGEFMIFIDRDMWLKK